MPKWFLVLSLNIPKNELDRVVHMRASDYRIRFLVYFCVSRWKIGCLTRVIDVHDCKQISTTSTQISPINSSQIDV